MTPMYYFHIRDGDKLEPDPDGTELPDIDAALAEALKVAQELASEIPAYDDATTIEIADGDGQALLSVPLSDAIWLKH